MSPVVALVAAALLLLPPLLLLALLLSMLLLLPYFACCVWCVCCCCCCRGLPGFEQLLGLPEEETTKGLQKQAVSSPEEQQQQRFRGPGWLQGGYLEDITSFDCAFFGLCAAEVNPKP